MSETIRVYTPPTAGSFDPYTAAITGNLPRFFGYRELPPPPVLTPAAAPSVLDGDGGVGDGVGGLGTGNVNMGGQMAGSIDVGPTPGAPSRGFGEASLGRTGSTLGTLAGLATGAPGLGLGLGALGTLADVQALNADLAAMGLPQDVAFGPAIAANLTGGFFGMPAATQFGKAVGYSAFAEAPLSAYGASQAAANQVDPAEAMAMEMGMQSPGFGTGSYGFGTSPTQGGSGNFGAMSAAERGEAIGPPDANAYGATAAAAAAQAQANAEAANIDADAQVSTPSEASTTTSTDTNSNAPSGPSEGAADGSAYREGGLVQLAGGGKIAVGPGGGLDDLIPTSINGRRAAALSDGEFVIPADVVSMMGDGSSNAGARRLYDLVKQVRDAKTGTTKQAGPLPVGEILKRSIGR